jgi:hypothetical protein
VLYSETCIRRNLNKAEICSMCPGQKNQCYLFCIMRKFVQCGKYFRSHAVPPYTSFTVLGQHVIEGNISIIHFLVWTSPQYCKKQVSTLLSAFVVWGQLSCDILNTTHKGMHTVEQNTCVWIGHKQENSH